MIAPEPPRYPVHVDIEPRFRDTDAMGHVNNAVYATYLEVGRQAYWRVIDPEARYNRVPFILARLEIDFRSPALVGETLRVFLRMSHVSRRSFGTEYEILDLASKRLVVAAKSVQVTYDYEQNQVIPVPETLRAALERVEGRSLPASP